MLRIIQLFIPCVALTRISAACQLAVPGLDSSRLLAVQAQLAPLFGADGRVVYIPSTGELGRHREQITLRGADIVLHYAAHVACQQCAAYSCSPEQRGRLARPTQLSLYQCSRVASSCDDAKNAVRQGPGRA